MWDRALGKESHPETNETVTLGRKGEKRKKVSLEP